MLATALCIISVRRAFSGGDRGAEMEGHRINLHSQQEHRQNVVGEGARVSGSGPSARSAWADWTISEVTAAASDMFTRGVPRQQCEEAMGRGIKPG